jgi:hypothetical protein
MNFFVPPPAGGNAIVFNLDTVSVASGLQDFRKHRTCFDHHCQGTPFSAQNSKLKTGSPTITGVGDIGRREPLRLIYLGSLKELCFSLK